MPLEGLMEIAAQSPYLAALIIVGYVFNRYHIESLKERKEILQSLGTERQEATASRERLIERYAAELMKSTEAQVDSRNQDHALRGTLTQHMVSQDANQREIIAILREIQGWARGQGGTNAKS